MRTLVKSEIRKFATTRSTWGILAGMVGVILLGVLQTSGPTETGKAIGDRQFFLLATINGSVFLLILGIKAVTDEFRYGTIVPTLLVTPRRDRVVAAKLAVAAAAGLFAATVTAAVMTAAALPKLDGIDAAEWRSLAGFVAAGSLWATLGAAIGLIVRHQVGAIVGAIVWVFGVEQIVASQLGRAADWLPGQAAGALSVATTIGSMAVGALILVLYVAGSGVVSGVVMGRRDVV